jgi:circadian clock protein KaiC
MLASAFAQAAARRHERVLYLNFEESQEAMISGMLSAGIDLRPAMRTQRLVVQTALPESMGSDNHLIRVLEAIDSFKPDHLILDAISACVRMGSERAAFDYLMRLVAVVKERGITCILTNQCQGTLNGGEELSGIGFSSVVDAVIQLRFVDAGQEIGRQILIIKSRGSGHSNRRESFYITDHGIEFPNNLRLPSARAGQADPKDGGK